MAACVGRWEDFSAIREAEAALWRGTDVAISSPEGLMLTVAWREAERRAREAGVLPEELGVSGR
ncbi:MAG: hypothetical protein P8R54_13870 [Myxococcota bacterium]|nr:hypothetical protein [Myxococcota bacterium]